MAALTLTAGLFAASGPAAQATPNGLYDCQRVSYFAIIVSTPVMGTGCVGPVGDQPAGTVYEIPTGKRYGCLHERGSLLPDGTLLVNGTSCTPF